MPPNGVSSAPLELSFVLLHSCLWKSLGHIETLLTEPLSVPSPGKVWRGPTYPVKDSLGNPH